MITTAFIGLGNMGAPMAQNLLIAGEKLNVFDLVPAAVGKLAAAGATACDSLRAAVTGVDAIITMLPATEHSRQAYLGDDGILAYAKRDALLIDCSTINAGAAKEIAAAAREKGFTMLDAPVSGGTAGAERGTLTFIVGGDADTLARARPLLEKMGKNIFHAGGNGAGQMAKICNNMLLAILMIGTSEALALGAANGLDPAVLSEIIAKSSGRNWVTEVYNPWPGVMANVPAARDYTGGFGTDLMLKDLGLATEAAVGAATPLGTQARDIYAAWSAAGNGRRDFSSVLEFIRKG
ncbi:MAG TPA: 3-hydroxyisobutyrate dehydrogenase [Patescibacteria group bacterium]|nr:3-hydroxyisobutyrate dehydrogenase [Patescibacteria group bacterium]